VDQDLKDGKHGNTEKRTWGARETTNRKRGETKEEEKKQLQKEEEVNRTNGHRK